MTVRGGTTGSAGWDARYASTDLVWSPEPNVWAVEVLEGRAPGSALDLGTGEGRHALWLARLGWEVTAVDFSGEALRKARAVQAESAPQTAGRITWLQADVVQYVPQRRSSSAVVMMYLHLDPVSRRTVVRNAAKALAVGGVLLVVGHDTTNPAEGFGGPSDPDVLFSATDVVVDLAGLPGLTIRRAERVRRPVRDGQVALDALVEVIRTA